MSNLNSLRSDINRINNLIDEATVLMHSPVSNLASDLGSYLEKNSSRIAPAVWNQLRNMTNKGRLDTVIVGALVLGTAFVGAKTIDVTRNTIAHHQADKKIKAYHQELAVKQNLLIEEQQKIILRLNSEVDILAEEREEIQKTVNNMAQTISAIQVILNGKGG